MKKKLAIATLALLPLTLYYASTKPDTLHVERSIVIQAPAATVFPLINSFFRWEEWTPYNKDKKMKKLFSGSPSGAGARYEWQGDATVGQGEISIVQAVEPSQIVLDLHMIKPIEARNPVIFTLTEDGDSTKVTWGMDCRQNLLSKVIDTFYSMNRMIGADFESGLATLKVVSENRTKS